LSYTRVGAILPRSGLPAAHEAARTRVRRVIVSATGAGGPDLDADFDVSRMKEFKVAR
jgi:hypothetical protein